ncbi:hypothetical protein V7S43_010086 [Phytophthora oleae]|uniref:Uncharacterized protein n=1 Tax=Phytophthora oleae TaxID=2107226 RepID=A0ABD3FIW7_9STRA
MHCWYNGLSAVVPVMNISIRDISEVRDNGNGNRYKVDLIVRAIDEEYAKLISMGLKEDFEVLEGGLKMRTFVYIQDPEVFCKCTEWKRNDIDKKWKDYYEMTPAVD